MSYLKRRDWFYGALIAIGLIAYFVYDIDIQSYSWPIKLGIAGSIMSLYLLFVQIPSIGDELTKQYKINERLNDKIIELNEKIKYGGKN